jgi:hypothetical protein
LIREYCQRKGIVATSTDNAPAGVSKRKKTGHLDLKAFFKGKAFSDTL